jgi:periplasmic divalent cation tolerance protein
LTGCSTLYITASSVDEAELIGRTLVAERLVACANLVPGVRSFYQWDGKVQDGEEVLVLCKTRTDLAEGAIARVKALHSYDCPCIVALPIETGNPDYLDWIKSETQISEDTSATS